MCGIAGIISQNHSISKPILLQRMCNALAHRGPDSHATWISPCSEVGFAHTRLCVIDRSSAAEQPMHYSDDLTIIFNGEIYNHPELRTELKSQGFSFKSQSDTEVVIAAYAAYGKECLQHFDGMFSFAIWDSKKRELFCARDRFGEKPFYFHVNHGGDTLRFGSELKALYRAGVTREINHSLFLSYLLFGVTSNPADASECFDKNIRSLPAGHYLLYSAATNTFQIRRYFDLQPWSSATIAEGEASVKLRELIRTSVSRRLRSDVPLGINLSGGLDSSTIAAMVPQTGTAQRPAFTAVFPGFDKDERMSAALVAELFGFKQFTVAPAAEQFAADLPKLLLHQEGPFSSSSVYAQYRVFQLAKAHGTIVLLDGQGADEVFAGYEKYRNWKLLSVAPGITRKLLELKQRRITENARLIERDYLLAHKDHIGIRKPEVQSLNSLLYYNIFLQGLEELLRYADRNSMAHGTEVRLPFLSHELVQFAFSLPSSFKIRREWTKYILRQTMAEVLPRQVAFNRRKIGFEPPQADWMRNNEVRVLIGDSRRILQQSGILNNAALRKEPHAHAAYDRSGMEWRWLIGGQWLQAIKKGSE